MYASYNSIFISTLLSSCHYMGALPAQHYTASVHPCFQVLSGVQARIVVICIRKLCDLVREFIVPGRAPRRATDCVWIATLLTITHQLILHLLSSVPWSQRPTHPMLTSCYSALAYTGYR